MFAPARRHRTRLIADGQSLNLLTDGGFVWVTRCVVGSGQRQSNLSIGATAWSSLVPRCKQELEKVMNKSERDIVSLGIGAESDLLDGRSADDILGSLQSYASTVRAINPNALVIGLTVPPSTAFNPTQNAQRVFLNAGIMSDGFNIFDAEVDVTTAPLNDATNASYFYDGLHLANLGHEAVKDKFMTVVKPMFLY